MRAAQSLNLMNGTENDSTPQNGFTLIEIMVATGILVIAVTALAAVFLVATRQSTQNNGEVLLTAAARNIIATLQGEDFASLTQNNQRTFYGAQNGTISFTDPGSAPVSGTVEFFDDEDDIPSSFGDLSGSFDLNANGIIDASPVSDYKVLPTRIDLNLNDPNDSRTITIDVLLTQRSS